MTEQQTRLPRGSTRRRRRFALLRGERTALLAALGASVALLAAACGGGSGAGVATGPTATTAADASAGRHVDGNADARGPVAYAACVRAHGVPGFPDPDGSGHFPKEKLLQLGVNPSRFRAETRVCNHLLPAGPSGPTITAQAQQDYLRAAACMRSHGITGFPDPTFSDGSVELHLPSSIDTHSTRFTRAAQTCRKLIPRGLPYSE